MSNQENTAKITILIGDATTDFDVEDFIDTEYFFTAEDGVDNNNIDDGVCISELVQLARVAFCVLTLKNGFRVVGSCITENGVELDKELGYQLAREDAVQQAQPFIAFMKQQATFEDALMEEFLQLTSEEQAAAIA